MSSHEQLIAKLAILDAPLPPDWTVPLFIMGFIVILMPIATIMLTLRINRARSNTHLSLKQQALIQLNKLETAYASQQCDQRQAAYQLATLLRLGLSLQQFDDSPFQNDPHWQRLTLSLNNLRYPADAELLGNEHALSAETFQAARHWLTHTDTRQDQSC